MKTKTILLAFFVTLINVASLMAENPGDPGNPAGDPAPVEGPIDENIDLLFGAALVLGVTLIYKNKIKKASV